MLVHRRVTFSSMSPVPIYTPGWRGTMWVKVSCLRKKHDGKDWASSHRPSDLKFNALTTTPPRPHILVIPRDTSCSQWIRVVWCGHTFDHRVVSILTNKLSCFSYHFCFPVTFQTHGNAKDMHHNNWRHHLWRNLVEPEKRLVSMSLNPWPSRYRCKPTWDMKPLTMGALHLVVFFFYSLEYTWICLNRAFVMSCYDDDDNILRRKRLVSISVYFIILVLLKNNVSNCRWLYFF